ncbi:GGDEF domain-containing protein [Caenibius tardaugens]|uniref:GGDEF domain-containing protein n=1 Tax=Caenibius tardaugens TaxID=169176 RepID=UPI0006907118|nr:GGDEF domain-containing protein [Caenibius tardaugens]AZI37417.1 GGDEF domain-containing protein [Caenibius tardaugens NBRC 16725]
MNTNRPSAEFAENTHKPLKSWPSVVFSVVATLIPLALVSYISGIAIEPVYWAFAIFCPLVISYFVSRKFIRMSEHIRNLHSDLSNAHEALKHVAEHDALTQTLNRRGFLHRLELSRTNGPGWLLLLDIDRFKAINDRHGDETGDHVLHTIALHLRRGIRTDDCVGRLGGEEFAIFLPGANRETALAMAESIRQGIANTAFTGRSGALHGITISIGLAHLAPSLSIPDCLRMADVALYQAKDDGRNCVKVGECIIPAQCGTPLFQSLPITTR